jgi:hypothetical protein
VLQALPAVLVALVGVVEVALLLLVRLVASVRHGILQYTTFYSLNLAEYRVTANALGWQILAYPEELENFSFF